MTIGVVGLGPVGIGMTRRLFDAGHVLVVSDRAAARRTLVEVGMLDDDQAVSALMRGQDDITTGLAAGAVHISTSTISVTLSQCPDRAHGARAPCSSSSAATLRCRNAELPSDGRWRPGP